MIRVSSFHGLGGRPVPRGDAPIQRSSEGSSCRIRCQSTASSSLAAGQRLTASRAHHSRLSEHSRLYEDSLASQLLEVSLLELEGHNLALADLSSALDFDDVATAFLDRSLATAVGMVNMDLQQEYRQIVLVGCGLDTRPYRLSWPEGTVLFELAAAEAHAFAKQRLLQCKACVPRGSLLRRVNADIQGGGGFEPSLVLSGFRGSRLSIWGIQGVHHLGLQVPQMRQLFAEVANLAAQNSLIVGELPAMSRSAAADMLAEAGMLSRILCAVEACEELSIPVERQIELPEQSAEVQRWLFTAQHKHLSSEEMGILSGHTQAAEETDEDFFDNIS